MIDERFKARIEQIHRDLDAYSYYQLLNLSDGASPDDVRAAFHRMAMNLHPDRYHSVGDAELRGKVKTIYKRIAEGYRVLMDHEARNEYAEALQRGERRLVKTERKRATPQRPEDTIDNPQARKYFVMGEEAQRRGDAKNARMYFKFASDLVGEHPLIQEKLEALQEAAQKK